MASSGFEERIADWIPETLVVDHRAVTAAGAQLFHGVKGEAGYDLLHGDEKVTPSNVMTEDQEAILQEDLDNAYFAGFNSREYMASADSGSADYDPDDAEIEAGQVNFVEWDGLAQYYASGAGGTWFGDFESARRIRRAANAAAGLDQTGHDMLLGEGETDDYDHVTAVSLLMGVATAPALDRELYRGSFYAGADPDELEAQLRESGSLDFSVASFTDGRDVADYFADPSLYPGDEAPSGVRVMYVVEPGAQGILGHAFAKSMRAGYPGDEDDRDYINSDEALTDLSTEHPREIVSGGRFDIGDITREGDLLTVRLRQTQVYPPQRSAS